MQNDRIAEHDGIVLMFQTIQTNMLHSDWRQKNGG